MTVGLRIDGAVSSIAKDAAPTTAELPARSVRVADTAWGTPSRVSVVATLKVHVYRFPLVIRPPSTGPAGATPRTGAVDRASSTLIW